VEHSEKEKKKTSEGKGLFSTTDFPRRKGKACDTEGKVRWIVSAGQCPVEEGKRSPRKREGLADITATRGKKGGGLYAKGKGGGRGREEKSDRKA